MGRREGPVKNVKLRARKVHVAGPPLRIGDDSMTANTIWEGPTTKTLLGPCSLVASTGFLCQFFETVK